MSRDWVYRARRAFLENFTMLGGATIAAALPLVLLLVPDRASPEVPGDGPG